MPIEGFELQQDGKQSGLLWVTFANIQSHGAAPGSAAYAETMRMKASLVDRVLATEFRLGTKHYSKDGKPLKSPAEVLHSYRTYGGYYVDLPRDRRWKLEGLIKAEGIVNHDANDGSLHGN